MPGKDTVVLARLKKKIQKLQKQEEVTRRQLSVAMQKLHKLGIAYKSKIHRNVHKLHGKYIHTQAVAYAKAARDIEKQLQKSLLTRGKAIATTIAKFEKKHLANLKKKLQPILGSKSRKAKRKN